MNYLILISIGFAPSLIWLFYYLRKDPHPEPKRLILQVFLLGIAITPIAIILELIASNIIRNSIILLFSTAFIEEYLKFWIVKKRMLKDSEMDEPTDAMIYLIIAGLGFAALENLFYLQKIFAENNSSFDVVFQLAFLRFITAVFLHALASGSVGYFWALSLLSQPKAGPPRAGKIKSAFIIFSGLIFATLFHSFYNYLIYSQQFQFLPFLLWILAIFVAIAFKKLR